MESLEISLLSMRVIRRLIPRFQFPNREDIVREVWQKAYIQLGESLNFISRQDTLGLTLGPQNAIEKLLIQIAKLHLTLAREHPAAFALLPSSVDIARSYWQFSAHFGQTYGIDLDASSVQIGQDGDQDYMVGFDEQLTLKGLLLLRTCSKIAFHPITTISFQQKEDKEEKRMASELMRNEIFDIASVRDMIATLMTRFFVFTYRDLRQWEEEPDEWEKTQEGAGDDWEFSIRTCAEKLFLDLVINLKDHMVPFLIETLQKRSGLSGNDDVLLKDSVYAAIGLAAPVLEGHFDFATFLNSNLVSEIQLQAKYSKILRRRIAIMLGQWVPVQITLDGKLIYGIFQYLLNKNDTWNDQVVRVTAGRQLHNVVDPLEFDATQFSTFASSIVEALVSLIEEVELTETKLALLNTLSLIVTKLELHVRLEFWSENFG